MQHSYMVINVRLIHVNIKYVYVKTQHTYAYLCEISLSCRLIMLHVNIIMFKLIQRSRMQKYLGCMLTSLVMYVGGRSFVYHSMNIPRIALVGDPIGGWSLLSVENRPCLGFNISVATNPVTPPTTWTGPAPAMSITPISYSQPPGAQTQWAGMQKMNVFSMEKTI